MAPFKWIQPGVPVFLEVGNNGSLHPAMVLELPERRNKDYEVFVQWSTSMHKQFVSCKICHNMMDFNGRRSRKVRTLRSREPEKKPLYKPIPKNKPIPKKPIQTKKPVPKKSIPKKTLPKKPIPIKAATKKTKNSPPTKKAPKPSKKSSLKKEKQKISTLSIVEEDGDHDSANSERLVWDLTQKENFDIDIGKNKVQNINDTDDVSVEENIPDSQKLVLDEVAR